MINNSISNPALLPMQTHNLPSVSRSEPTLNNLAISITHVNNGPLELEKKNGLLLVLGKNGFDKKSTYLSMLGQQIPRVLSQKPLYPAIFLNKDAASEFKKVASDFDRAINPYGFRNEIPSEALCTEIQVTQALAKVAREQLNLTISDINPKEFGKVYITGHGEAGVDELQSGESFYSAKEVVELLVDSGILNQIKDIRLTCCHSADKRQVKHFTKDAIVEANKDSSFVENILYGKQESFMQKIANEIWNRGYTDVQVSGYHGAGIFYKDELPVTHIRAIKIPKTDAEGFANETIKRELVRETLILESSIN